MFGVVCSAIARKTRATSSSDTSWSRRKLARDMRRVDFEPPGLGGVLRCEAEIVEHRADVQELGVGFESKTLALQRAEQKDASRVVVQQVALDVADELGCFADESAIGNLDPGDDFSHGASSGSIGVACLLSVAVPARIGNARTCNPVSNSRARP